MNHDDYAYFRSRAVQEEEAARSAACDAARERHLELADAYRARCILILATMDTGSASIDLVRERKRPGAGGYAPSAQPDCETA